MVGAWYDKFWLQPLAEALIQSTYICTQDIHFVSKCVPWNLTYDFGSTSCTLYKYSYRLNYCADWDDQIQSSLNLCSKSIEHETHWRRVHCLLTNLTKTVWALLYLLIYPSNSSFPKPTLESHASVPACVTRSVFLPAQVSSVISISVVMATQQQGGKWQPNLWHSCRPGQAWGQGWWGGGIAAMGCRTLQGLPALNQILLTSEKNENILIPSATVLVRLMSQIFTLTPVV